MRRAGTLVAHFFMQGQRHATRPCVATSEPDFDDGMLFQCAASHAQCLAAPAACRVSTRTMLTISEWGRLHASDRAALKTLNDQLHVVVVQHSPDDSVNVVGTQRV